MEITAHVPPIKARQANQEGAFHGLLVWDKKQKGKGLDELGGVWAPGGGLKPTRWTLLLGPHSIPFSWLQDPPFIQPFPRCPGSLGTPNPATPALGTGMGKYMDPTLPSWTKAHVLLLVKKVELFFLEVKGGMQTRGVTTAPRNKSWRGEWETEHSPSCLNLWIKAYVNPEFFRPFTSSKLINFFYYLSQLMLGFQGLAN